MPFFLFPGQGSQCPQMGRDFYEQSPEARAVFDEAAGILGQDFLKTIFEGDAEQVNHTTVAQPGLLVSSVATAAFLHKRGIEHTGCAGHSLGEISALVVAGVCKFADAVAFTRERARLMSENVPEGGMAAVMGLPPEAIEAALPEDVQAANFNGPQQTIISGSKAGIEAAEAALKEAGAKRVLPLKVSGPFHSKYMKPAAEAFAEVLNQYSFLAPEVPFVSSVTGGPVSDPEQIRKFLARQLYSPIQWTRVMATVGEVPALEVGPGSVLKGIARRADKAPSIQTVSSYEEACGIETDS